MNGNAKCGARVEYSTVCEQLSLHEGPCDDQVHENEERLVAYTIELEWNKKRLEDGIREHKRRCVEDDHNPTEYEGLALFTSTVDLWSLLPKEK